MPPGTDSSQLIVPFLYTLFLYSNLQPFFRFITLIREEELRCWNFLNSFAVKVAGDYSCGFTGICLGYTIPPSRSNSLLCSVILSASEVQYTPLYYGHVTA